MAFACVKCGRVSDERYCESHRGRNGGRPSSFERGYGSEFKRNRKQLLASNPVCCVEGCETLATVADHDPPRRVLVAIGVKDPDARRWLRPMCISHHNARAAKGV